MTTLKTNFPVLVSKKEVEMNKRLTQEEIAQILEVSPATVSRWMTGVVTSLTHPTLIKMCEFFRCDVGELLHIEFESDPQ